MSEHTVTISKCSARCAVLLAVLFGAASAAEPSFEHALLGGKPSLNLRMRLENVRDDSLQRSASAPTYRARFSYETLSWHHASLALELDQLGTWGGAAYNSTRNGRIDRPLVTDPAGADLNQLAVKLAFAKDDFVLGRQRLVLDNQRFIGSVAWRQNEQTFDAALWRSRRLRGTTLSYAYVDNVNRVFGPANGTPPADLRMRAQLLNAAFDLKAAGKLSAFGYWMDIRNAAALSNQNLGVLWSGSHALSGDWKLPWSASYVLQQDYGRNPTRYSSHYYQLEAGVARASFDLRAGIEVLSGDASRSERRFQTPLASLHVFQGWADKFLTTPPQGVRDGYVSLTARRWGFESKLAWHDFRADALTRHYGSEWDASLSRKFGKNTELLLKLARYDSAGFASDTRKLWLQFVTEFP